MKAKWYILFMEIFILFYSGAGQTWTCKNGALIDRGWLCDGEFDCPDKSDESLDACPSRPCDSNEFRCDSGSCIPAALECNGEVDCSIGGVVDSSDETRQCEEGVGNHGCDANLNLLCPNGRCIPLSWVCDDMNDCDDDYDEQRCDKECPPKHLACKNSLECVDEQWICDGENDCDDGEDEMNCTNSNFQQPVQGGLCSREEFECGGKCLAVTKACDGSHDCENGEDEGAQCREGECRWRGSPSAWTDHTSLCDQGCRRTLQGPKCFCLSGYRLEPDGFRCRPADLLPLLTFIADNQIRGAVLDSTMIQEQLIFVEADSPQVKIGCFTAYDEKSDSLIIVDDQSSWIKIRNGAHEVNSLVKIEGIHGISLDWLVRNLYVIYKSSDKYGGLLVFGLAQTKPDLYQITISLDDPVAITVAPRRGKMFIADQGINQTFSRLIMANMDGSDVVTLAAEESRRMVGVAYDFITDLVYWSEFNEDEARIELISIREFERKTLLSSLSKDIPLSNPVSLDVFGNKLFFVDNKTKEIWSVDSITGKASHFLNDQSEPLIKVGIASRLAALHVLHPLRQPETYGNPCLYSQCSHFCVLHPGGGRCLCPDSMFLDYDLKTCIEIKANENSARFLPITIKSNAPFITIGPTELILPNSHATDSITTTTVSLSTTTTMTTPPSTTTSPPSTTTAPPSTTTSPPSTTTAPPSTTTSPPSTTTAPPSTTTSHPTTTTAPPSTTTSPSTTTAPPSTTTSPPTTTTAQTSTTTSPPTTTTTPTSTTTSPPTTTTTPTSTTTSPPTMTTTPTSTTTSTTKTTTTSPFRNTETIPKKQNTKIFKTVSTHSSKRTTIAFGASTTTTVPTLTVKSINDSNVTLCPKPVLLKGMKVSISDNKVFTQNSRFVYSCLNGWFFKEFPSKISFSVTCLKSGKWSDFSPICEKYTCSNLNCGRSGKCILVKNDFAACRCENGTLLLSTPCSSEIVHHTTISPVQSRGTQKSRSIAVVIVLVVLAAAVLIGLIWRKRHQLRKPRYSLVEKDEPSPSCQEVIEKSNVAFSSEKSKDGFFNPNYSGASNCRIRLSLPDRERDRETIVDQSNNSLKKDSPVSYKCLAQSAECELTGEKIEDIDGSKTNLDEDGSPKNLLGGIGKSVRNAFNLKRSESLEKIVDV